MGWLFDTDELKTKEDYINQLKEIEAYRELDGENFDFGNGLIINEMSQGSEDAYYEMDIENLNDVILYWELNNEEKETNKSNSKLNSHSQKVIDNRKLNHLEKISWRLVVDKDGFKQRCYRGGRSKYLKQISNKQVRRYDKTLPSKGGAYKKVFDFWWKLE